MELDIKYFDLGVTHRDATDDKVTVESAEATLKYVISLMIHLLWIKWRFVTLCFQLSMCSNLQVQCGDQVCDNHSR